MFHAQFFPRLHFLLLPCCAHLITYCCESINGWWHMAFSRFPKISGVCDFDFVTVFLELVSNFRWRMPIAVMTVETADEKSIHAIKRCEFWFRFSSTMKWLLIELFHVFGSNEQCIRHLLRPVADLFRSRTKPNRGKILSFQYWRVYGGLALPSPHMYGKKKRK